MSTYVVSETVVQYGEGADYGLLDVSLEVGDEYTVLHAEDANGGADVKLDADELDALIDTLQRARDAFDA